MEDEEQQCRAAVVVSLVLDLLIRDTGRRAVLVD